VGEHSSWQWRPEYEQVWGGPDECLETIADVHADDGEMMESRGRLIAAAPALLAACQAALAWDEDEGDGPPPVKPWGLLRAAVELATEGVADG
jgi:hypothetical protein